MTENVPTRSMEVAIELERLGVVKFPHRESMVWARGRAVGGMLTRDMTPEEIAAALAESGCDGILSVEVYQHADHGMSVHVSMI